MCNCPKGKEANYYFCAIGLEHSLVSCYHARFPIVSKMLWLTFSAIRVGPKPMHMISFGQFKSMLFGKELSLL